MKVCENCGGEIGTKDGENLCQYCDTQPSRRMVARDLKRDRESILRSLGLVKVRGAMGGTYWE